MSEERLVKRIYRAEMEGARGRCRPRTRWGNGARKVVGERGVTIMKAERRVQDRKEWGNT